MSNPLVIQGGMGIGVSNWTLAKAVASYGQLGVISGTGLDILLVRRLQNGDPGGHMRRALSAFPFKDIAHRIVEEYFVKDGIPRLSPFKRVPNFTYESNDKLEQLNVAANFAETWLAKEGHSGQIGVNYLAKLQLPTLSSIYGALLAGIDYIIMGAGIPIEIPGVIGDLSQHSEAKMRLDVEGADKDESFFSRFNPRALFSGKLPEIKRPKFLPIVSSNFLASIMLKKANGPIDGLIMEGPSAGGHNAPPRGKMALDDQGEPIYGKRDVIDMGKLRELKLPFWLAGSYGTPEGLDEALSHGAQGIQVGSPFALCKESGIFPELRQKLLSIVRNEKEQISTDVDASPTGFPFKVMHVGESISEQTVFDERKKICNMGYLQHLYKREDGSVGYRCAAEAPGAFKAKGGELSEATARKKCLCNSLFATIGYPTVYEDGYVERALITIGSSLESIRSIITEYKDFSAKDVLDYILKRD